MLQRLILAALAALLLAAPASTQTPDTAPAASEQPNIGQPTGPERFASEMARFDAEDAAHPPGRCTIVFTGSSTIRRWDTLQADMAPFAVINRGFGGSQIADVNFWFERAVARYRPRAIVFYAGDNDINAGRTPGQVVADFQTFLELKAQGVGRDVPVFFIAVKPSRRRWEQFGDQSQVNDAIRQLAARRRDLIFVDIVEPMLENERPRDIFVEDGLHMTPAGYAIWTPIVREALRGQERRFPRCR